MSANHIYERADKAARTVDPLMLASALDHIAKTAAKSRTQTRRLRWIQARAELALAGREYKDIDLDLPRDGGPETASKLKRSLWKMKQERDELLSALADLVGWQTCAPDEVVASAHAAIAKATGEQQ